MDCRVVEDRRQLDWAEPCIVHRLAKVDELLDSIIVHDHYTVVRAFLEVALASIGDLLLKD
jgi:hypothetical protein